MTRRKARETVFSLIFEYSFSDNDKILEEFLNTHECKKQEKYIEKVFFGVIENLKNIDDTIKKNLKKWEINRLSKITLALLRIGVYEIFYIEDIPITVTNNEITSLANKYGENESINYINGILGQMQKEIEINKQK